MREPLVWFVLIGMLLFTLDRFTTSDPVIVDDAVRVQISSLWQTQMGTPPDEKELDSLVSHWVREELFFREAIRLGLDKDDTIIRRRLVQKLEFLAQEVNEDEITREDIEQYYESHTDDYTLPVRYSFSQIYYNNADITEYLLARLEAGENWQTLGESSLLPRSMIRKSSREITSTFGTAFSGQVTELAAGDWVGPVTSTFGYHLVRIDAVADSEVTPLAHVEKQVITDLLQERREASLENYYQTLLDQHDVEYR